MTYERVAAVTGANKGIGLAIVRQLALKHTAQTGAGQGRQSFLIYLTSRDRGRGEQAVAEIEGDAALRKAKALTRDGGATEVRWHELDVSREESIGRFAAHLREQHGAIDVAVNNAGVALDGFDGRVVASTLEANYYGVLNATRAFLGVLKPEGRIVNVASVAGRLGAGYSDEVKRRFHEAAKSSTGPGQATALMREFQAAVDAGSHGADGWPSSAYKVSKAGCIAMTMAIAREEKAKGNAALINACCPGYVNTDMTKHRGVKTPDQGAKTPVMLALDDIGGTTGEMWSDEKLDNW